MPNPGFQVRGFEFSSTSCGIKEEGLLDLALIYSRAPCTVAGTFTTNRFRAAPVLVTRERIAKGKAQAVIINSGNANAGTGDRGRKDSLLTASLLERRLKLPPGSALVCSTGRIGIPLPMDKIRRGIGPLVEGLSPYGYFQAARAMMTTDRHPKVVAARERMGGAEVNFLGIAKGAGMICPQMATMLSLLVTDLKIDRVPLMERFKRTVDLSFNRITVDGQRSTNDTAIIMANGLAENKALNGKELKRLEEVLSELHLALARAMVKDGEGATKLLEITVTQARNDKEAKRAAYAVGNSNLVKTAFFGEQLNWGRIVSALGASGINLDPHRVRIWIGGVKVVEGGARVSSTAEKRATHLLKGDEIKILISLGDGKGEAAVYASDMGFDYVRLNASYEGPV